MSRSASGSGTIRKKEITRDGKKYTYWEARYTAGRKPDGTQLQKSITGKTQKEVAKKLKEATLQVDNGLWREPTKITVESWLDTWAKTYLVSVKPLTAESYKAIIKNHINPAIGKMQLAKLLPHDVQKFYNSLELSPKTVKNIHGVLHKALNQAVEDGLLTTNPTASRKLPKAERKEITPLDDDGISALISACDGYKFPELYKITFMLGLRRCEALGLTWDCIDFETGVITIKQQLQKISGQYTLVSTKSGRIRRITASNAALSILRQIHSRQQQEKAEYADVYTDQHFVFCDSTGEHYKLNTVEKDFKKLVTAIGLPNTRLHDLRHSYAVTSLKSGDDIKTVQSHLGHATASFTLDVYGHVTEDMQRSSASRMDQYLASLSDKGKTQDPSAPKTHPETP